MQINGNKLREAIRDQMLVRDAANAQFESTLYKFDDESKDTPQSVMNTLEHAEGKIARLQSLQKQFNCTTLVTVPDGNMSLECAIKTLGGLERIEQLWKGSLHQVQRDERRRVKRLPPVTGQTVVMTAALEYEDAKPSITPEMVLRLQQAAAKRVNAYKSAIANGNAMNIDLEVDPTLFASE